MLAEEKSGQVGFRQGARSTERESEARPRQEFKLDLDEELTEDNEAKRTDDAHNKEWLHAMQDEMDSLHENHTFDLMELPEERELSETNGFTS